MWITDWFVIIPPTKDLLNWFPYKFAIQPKSILFQHLPTDPSGPTDRQILKRSVAALVILTNQLPKTASANVNIVVL